MSENVAASAQVLTEGDLIAIFPEGGITRDGTLGAFKGDPPRWWRGLVVLTEKAMGDLVGECPRCDTFQSQ